MVDEETPLLDERDDKPTPLPKLTLSLMLLMQLCEPLSSQVIYPFIAELVASLPITGGDTKKIGYYAGLIESIFFAVEALTILHWSRTSDYVGRKPVLLIGLVGSCISTLCFGLSTTFPALVISRALTGLLNGNIAVAKSMMGEITDSTNRAQAFSFLPTVWALGATLGPLMGGTLARPHERFPNVFKSKFWATYPYFLPCAVPAMYTLIVIVLASFLLEETIPDRRLPPFLQRFKRSKSKMTSTDSESDLSTIAERSFDDPPPLRQLLKFPVIVSVANYGFLAFLDIMLAALRPLFYAVPIAYGGFGLSPATIGVCLGLYGIACGVVQGLCFARCIKRFGPRRVFLTGLSTSFVIFSLFPLIHLVAIRQGRSPLAWALVVIQLGLSPIMDMCFGTVFMYVTTSAPNNRCLGAVNGMAQTTASCVRAVGPALVSSLFSLSIEYHILGGYGVYAFLLVMCGCSLYMGTLLPARMWTH